MKKLLLLISFMLLTSLSWCYTYTVNFESDTVGTSPPTGWAIAADQGGTVKMTVASGTVAPFGGSNKAARLSNPGPNYGWFYTPSSFDTTTSDFTVSYWTYFTDTSYGLHNGEIFILKSDGLERFQISLSGGTVYTAGDTLQSSTWGPQPIYPAANTWHQVKFWVHYGNPGSVDFFWNNMTTPVSTGNKGLGTLNNWNSNSLQFINWSPHDWFVDEMSVTWGLQSTSPAPVISPSGWSLRPLQSVNFSASGGTPPYTWALSTTGYGTLSATTGVTVTFTAANTTGTVQLKVTDSASQTANVTIAISPTSAGIMEDSDPIVIQGRMSLPQSELFE